jgi:hypothetical protein
MAPFNQICQNIWNEVFPYIGRIFGSIHTTISLALLKTFWSGSTFETLEPILQE